MAHEITLAFQQMTEDIKQINVEKEWRTEEGSTPGRKFGDDMALLHTEVSEAFEAFRQWGLEDATEIMYSNTLPKPEGVGSEFADVLIRLIDMADRHGIDLVQEYHRKMAFNRTRPFRHGGKAL